jgi:DNA adenine methylase
VRRPDPSRPVLKWAGGKRHLLRQILDALPPRIDTYYEPFVGGGAVFFALAAENRFQRAVIADRNEDLVEVYRALRSDVAAVIRALKRYRYDEDTYYRVRAARPRGLAQRAARLIYLNKTGYNGLYRVNRKGEYNVPFGRHRKPNICDEANLRSAAAALQRATVESADFEAVCGRAGPGDAVYLDPPYLPLSRTSSFAAYDRHPFGLEEHQRLASVFSQLAERGVPAVLSNSLTPQTQALFQDFEMNCVRVPRYINCRADSRGPVREILVVSRCD